MLNSKKPSEAALALLDSSLITQTNKKKYNIKIINCNNFIQTYIYENIKTIMDKGLESSIKKKTYRNKEKVKTNKFSEARKDNLFRAKNNCERLAKTNANEFKSFITLTYKENINQIKLANKDFNVWRTRIKKIYPNFKYICVPEFQKRGSVHYHLLTNIQLNSEIIYLQEGKKCQYDALYWQKGFSSAEKVNDIKVATYISKYITKDYDSRYYSHRKYLYSHNLVKPKIEYLDLNDPRECNYMNKLLINYNMNYTNEYLNKYSSEKIQFIEYSNGYKI